MARKNPADVMHGSLKIGYITTAKFTYRKQAKVFCLSRFIQRQYPCRGCVTFITAQCVKSQCNVTQIT